MSIETKYEYAYLKLNTEKLGYRVDPLSIVKDEKSGFTSFDRILTDGSINHMQVRSENIERIEYTNTEPKKK